MNDGKPRTATLDFTLMFEDREWTAVTDFDRSGPEDRHFQVRVGEAGAVEIIFGDGQHGQRPPTGGGMRLAYRFGQRYAGVITQQGRVILDLDQNERGTTGNLRCGLYRGMVLSDADPANRDRLLVQSPAIAGGQAWALRCAPATARPDVGSQAWLAFEAGDPAHPVWLGPADGTDVASS